MFYNIARSNRRKVFTTRVLVYAYVSRVLLTRTDLLGERLLFISILALHEQRDSIFLFLVRKGRFRKETCVCIRFSLSHSRFVHLDHDPLISPESFCFILSFHGEKNTWRKFRSSTPRLSAVKNKKKTGK